MLLVIALNWKRPYRQIYDFIYFNNSSFCSSLKIYRFMASEETFVLKQHTSIAAFENIPIPLIHSPRQNRKRFTRTQTSPWMCALIKKIPHAIKMHDIGMAESILFLFSFRHARFGVCHGDPVCTIHIHHNQMANWHQNKSLLQYNRLLRPSDVRMTTKIVTFKNNTEEWKWREESVASPKSE